MIRTRSSSSSCTRLSLAAAALALALAACDNGRSLSVDELGVEVRAGICNILVLCDDMPDQATCLASTSTSIDATLKIDIENGVIMYDARAAGACVDAFKSLTACTETALTDWARRFEASCDKVFRGTIPIGNGCFLSEECAQQGFCSITGCSADGSCCVGICVARDPEVPVGGDCSTNQNCVAGTTCIQNPVTTTFTCRIPLAPGASCTTVDVCQAPYICRTSDPLAGSGICGVPPGTGEPCGVAGTSTTCNDGRDSCDPLTNRCTPSVPVGGTCGPSGPFCVDYATCDGTICVARPGPGDSCDPLAVSPCLGDLECDATMHCSLPPAGGSCR